MEQKETAKQRSARLKLLLASIGPASDSVYSWNSALKENIIARYDAESEKIQI